MPGRNIADSRYFRIRHLDQLENGENSRFALSMLGSRVRYWNVVVIY